MKSVSQKGEVYEHVFLTSLGDVVKREHQVEYEYDGKSDRVVDLVNQICWDPEMKEYFHVGLALRESGNLDFYCRFRLVEATSFDFGEFSEDEEESAKRIGFSRITSVNADFDYLYFRDKHKIHMCPIQWKIMIGLKTARQYKVHQERDKGRSVDKIWNKITRNTLG